jgi:hypothetical protein
MHYSNDNRLKLGVFGLNVSNGCAATTSRTQASSAGVTCRCRARCHTRTTACSSWMNCRSSAAMSWKSCGNRSRTVSQEYNLSGILNINISESRNRPPLQ